VETGIVLTRAAVGNRRCGEHSASNSRRRCAETLPASTGQRRGRKSKRRARTAQFLDESFSLNRPEYGAQFRIP
jgi:hypothetical protein